MTEKTETHTDARDQENSTKMQGVIHQCVAKTNQGDRCLNTTRNDDAICSSHARCETVTLVVVPEYEVPIRGFDPDGEPGEFRWDGEAVEALTFESACEKALDEAVGGLGEFSLGDNVKVAEINGSRDVFGPYMPQRSSWHIGQEVSVPSE